MGPAKMDSPPLRRRPARALALLGLGALVAVLAALPAEAQSGIVLDNDVTAVGFRETGNLGYEGLLPSMQPCAPNVGVGVPMLPTCNLMVGVRTSGTNFEGLTDNCVCEGWGVTYTSPAPVSGWAQYGQPMTYDGIGSIVFTPNPAALSAVSVVRVGDLEVTHEVQPEPLGSTLFRINVTIKNLGPTPVDGVVYRRVMDWDAEPQPYNEFVTISGSPTAVVPPAVPELKCSVWDPWVSADPAAIDLDDPSLLPPVGPGSACGGPPGTFGGHDRGAAFDFEAKSQSVVGPTLGRLGPGQYVRMNMWYGASHDSQVITDLVAINAQLVSIARPAYPGALAPYLTGPLDPPVIGPFMTYAWAYRWECVPGIDPACTFPVCDPAVDPLCNPCLGPNPPPSCNPCPNGQPPPCPDPIGPDPVFTFEDANGGGGFGEAVCSLTVQFIDQSRPGSSPIVEWYWEFGDGWASLDQNPVHTYPEPGTYTVSLTVTDASGLSATTTGSVVVGKCPDQAPEDPQDQARPPQPPRDGLDDDAANRDSDGDGIRDRDDLCPYVSDPAQLDLDGDLAGDACDDDIDGDGLGNVADNCVYEANPDQEDLDADAIGDACDEDLDGDGIANTLDNCPAWANPDQADEDGDGVGDVCEEGLLDTSVAGRVDGGAGRDANAFPLLRSPLREIALASLALLLLGGVTILFVAGRRRRRRDGRSR
jgi:hypothetical protein